MEASKTMRTAIWAGLLVLSGLSNLGCDQAEPEPAPEGALNRSFKCEQPLPKFTLAADSDPSDAELAELCSCIWSKLPEGGWEREVAGKIRRGEDPGWRAGGFVPRFGAAIDACGGRSL